MIEAHGLTKRPGAAYVLAWGELAVFACYAAILVVAGAVQFSSRDA